MKLMKLIDYLMICAHSSSQILLDSEGYIPPASQAALGSPGAGQKLLPLKLWVRAGEFTPATSSTLWARAGEFAPAVKIRLKFQALGSSRRVRLVAKKKVQVASSGLEQESPPSSQEKD